MLADEEERGIAAENQRVRVASPKTYRTFAQQHRREGSRQSGREKCYISRRELPRSMSGTLARRVCFQVGKVAEEADESLYWLELIRDGNFVSEKRIASLVSEGDELTAIFTSGRRSASRPQPSKIKPQTSSP